MFHAIKTRETFVIFFIFVSVFIIAQNAIAETLLQYDLECLKSLPQPPFLASGCEGECCGVLKSLTAKSSIPLRQEPRENAKIIGTIAKDEIFSEANFFIRVDALGKIKDHGRQYPILTYAELDSWIVWKNGKTQQIGGELPSDNGGIQLIQRPKTQDWVHIKSKNNVIGWVPLKFDDSGGDAYFNFGWCG